jgi:hypothetical protein
VSQQHRDENEAVWNSERAPAIATSAASGGVPCFTAVRIFCCAGQMRIHTFISMMVPNMAPMWMSTARPLNTWPRPKAMPVLSMRTLTMTSTPTTSRISTPLQTTT